MISCNTYDYVEIACLHQLNITIELINGELTQGRAVNTKILQSDAGQKHEYIELLVNGKAQLVRLSDIKVMKSNAQNPHFYEVNFISGSVIKQSPL